MKPILFILFLVHNLISFSQTQSEMNMEAYTEYKNSDKQLNEIYTAILSEYSKDEIFIDNLRKSQIIWIQFRDAEMNMKYPDYPDKYGSIHSLCWNIYLTKLTNERSNTLKNWVDGDGVNNWDSCCGSVKYTYDDNNADIQTIINESSREDLIKKNEENAYTFAKLINSISSWDSFLNDYPNGKYTNKAKTLRKEILNKNEEKAYTSAKQKNTVNGWKSFSNNYPNHWDTKSIKKKIIILEIENIISDSKTGELPNFSKTNTNYSSTSSVTINNDTDYELILRYSGPSIIKITIPRGKSKTTYLISGQYKISASANGLHYGGKEYLTGDYNSSYYITTSSY